MFLNNLPLLPVKNPSGQSPAFLHYQKLRDAEGKGKRASPLWKIAMNLQGKFVTVQEYRNLLMFDMCEAFTFAQNAWLGDVPIPFYSLNMDPRDWCGVAETSAADLPEESYERYLQLLAIAIMHNYVASADSYGYRVPGVVQCGARVESQLSAGEAAQLGDVLSQIVDDLDRKDPGSFHSYVRFEHGSQLKTLSGASTAPIPRVKVLTDMQYSTWEHFEDNTIYFVVD